MTETIVERGDRRIVILREQGVEQTVRVEQRDGDSWVVVCFEDGDVATMASILAIIYPDEVLTMEELAEPKVRHLRLVP